MQVRRLTIALALLYCSFALAQPNSPAAINMKKGNITPLYEEIVVVKFGDLEEIRRLLTVLVPDVKLTVLVSAPRQLLLLGTQDALEQAKELLDVIDKPLVPLVLECKLAELSDIQTQGLGVKWDATSYSSHRWECIGANEAGAIKVNVPLRVGTFDQKQLDYGFLVAQSESHVLASPRVAIQEDVEAQVNIGDKFPTTTIGNGQFENSYLDLGLHLSFRCKLNPDGRIFCHLQGEFRLLRELLAHKYPLLQATTFEEDFELNDGQSLILGGLAEPKEIQVAAANLALLRDLPVQGPLFRDHRDNQELYLILTPNVMK